MAGLVLYCRAGFEKDLANEVQQKASELGLFGYAQLVEDSGYVFFHCYDAAHSDLLAKKLLLTKLIFARQLFASTEKLSELDPSDRISPILAGCEDFPLCGELRVEYADTTDGRELSKFCRKFSVPLRQALRKRGKLLEKDAANQAVMHVFFVDSATAYLGYSYNSNNSAHALGILRLKFPSAAPSRSTLKLDEAFQMFIPKAEQAHRLSGGLHAVDLGACPGGWTYQLVKRGMFVQAVDNGAMDAALMETGQVSYFAEDGFKFRAKKHNIYWLVCDMIEQPQRVANLMAQWLAEGWCQEAMFNLKLPMKRRYESVQEALGIIAKVLSGAQITKYELQVKHLYHDREEVTVHLRQLQ
jgi:23S rRNA (cytidine2498-2'-O)-methyltransferase